jgi:hypothetical protein
VQHSLPIDAPSLKQDNHHHNVKQSENKSRSIISTIAATRRRNVNTTLSAIPNKSPLKLSKILAIYFPQFHRDALNDKLWGDGFTDWTNLRQAPLRNRRDFKIARPTELGYYDLLNTTVRRRQGELAKQYGIDGFVYHHYWFYDQPGGPTLAAPLEAMLQDGEPNLPFYLNWVAENWTATWHRKQAGDKTLSHKESSQQVLQAQYFPHDDAPIRSHYQWLSQFFHHPNYITVHQKPVFMVYNYQVGIHAVIQRLKKFAQEDGFPGLHCILAMPKSHDDLTPPYGKDQGERQTLKGANAVFDRLAHYPYPFNWMRKGTTVLPDWCVDRRKHPKFYRSRNDALVGIPCAFDNTPRREAEQAKLWIQPGGEAAMVKSFATNVWVALYYQACCNGSGGDNNFILINAWNEWAEGMMLEPSDVYDRTFLEAIKLAKERLLAQGCTNSTFEDADLPVPLVYHRVEPKGAGYSWKKAKLKELGGEINKTMKSRRSF